jgi:multimeric flavodoxin WrbA
MNILILNGSPRKNGNTVKILRQIEDGIAKEHSVVWIDVIDLTIKPCIGCLRCRPNQECVLAKDDAYIVRQKINEADMLVIGTPTYWGNMSGPLKNLFDRSVTLFEDFSKGRFAKPGQKGKRAIIVTACGAPWPFNQLSSQGRGTIRSIKTVLHSGGYRISGIINYGGTALRREIPGRVLQTAKKMGRAF